ncbi:aldo/keto reductase [Echinicola sediminis]
MLDKLVLGTAGLGGVWGTIDEEESLEAILYGLEQGIGHIDTAPAYMDAEAIVGKALKQWKGQVPMISTKIGKKRGLAEQLGLTDYEPEHLKTSLYRSLERLHLQQIDLLFLHEPELIPKKKLGLIMDLLTCFKEEGLVKKVGLGGGAPLFLKAYVESGHFDVVMDFNGYNLVERKAEQVDFPYYKKHRLAIYEGSPLMMGLLGQRLEEFVKNRPLWLTKAHIQKARELYVLALEHKMELSSLAHRFLLNKDIVDKVVVGPSGLSQLKSTISDFKKGPLDKPLQAMLNGDVNR